VGVCVWGVCVWGGVCVCVFGCVWVIVCVGVCVYVCVWVCVSLGVKWRNNNPLHLQRLGRSGQNKKEVFD